MKGQHARTFYVTAAVLLTAIPVAFVKGPEGLTARAIALPFCGGLIWALSSLSAFVGTQHLGMAKAFGIWAPLNIIVSMAWGILLFGEFLQTGMLTIVLAICALALIIGGVLLIMLPGGSSAPAESTSRRSWRVGMLGAVFAGVGFASYFIPIRISGISMWTGMLPVAAGMFVGAAILAGMSSSSLKLRQPSHYARVLATGVLWAVGNYGALLLMAHIGTGKGFTIAQLCVVVNALVGVFWEHKPMPGTRAANFTFAGVAMATVGAVVLGNLK